MLLHTTKRHTDHARVHTQPEGQAAMSAAQAKYIYYVSKYYPTESTGCVALVR